MIIYVTKKTVDRFNMEIMETLSDNSKDEAQRIVSAESCNKMHEWGTKIFYFEKRKCIQLVHFATKFTLILVDIKVSDLEHLRELILHYLLTLYTNDEKMQLCIYRMLSECPELVYAKLTDKRIISTLNRTQLDFLLDGYRLYDYIENGILVTMKLNEDMNFKWLVTETIEKKTDYFFAGEKFKGVMMANYG
ncbi:hypothetical protein H9L01_03600 [Erysipelothrix inopinata]|uniref:DUF6933 domain-containing protein n=1 Tax=Erysipelothrix inopinata TaxID=225084 RepID=A0A7G9S0T4_9FIRM|nr:hypothetical protein [Erysipelothrix inopinata]QNN61459.1 hypothetical protein H9L01_03600 [Erysipelothrix inopinata]